MPTAYLDDRAVLRIAGDEARGFLQGILTCNMDRISQTQAGFGALLSPQGKILFDFLVVEDAEGFWLDTAAAQAEALVKRLSMYKLRAQVTITLDPARAVMAAWDGAPLPDLAYDDPRHAGLGRRALVLKDEAARADATAADYHAHRIVCGVPEAGRDFPFGDIFPHDADMDLIHGLDFKKGCYVGQEVVSRMEHRGTTRKRILPVMLRGSAPEAGTPILAGETAIGTMGTAAPSGHALALIRTDKAEEAVSAGQPLVAGGAIVELAPDHMPKG
jgi:folate-binding protein YgfZ